MMHTLGKLFAGDEFVLMKFVPYDREPYNDEKHKKKEKYLGKKNRPKYKEKKRLTKKYEKRQSGWYDNYIKTKT